MTASRADSVLHAIGRRPLNQTGTLEHVAVQQDSLERLRSTRDKNSIPILVVRLGPARDFLIAIALFALVFLSAAGIAFVMYG